MPKATALNLINTNSSEIVTINVTCNNGANDEIDINITPTIEKVIENARVEWQILKRKK